jgi:hypothetical protein
MGYYENATAESEEVSPNELLNASRIRKWLQVATGVGEMRQRPSSSPAKFRVTLLRDFSSVPPERHKWRVLPVEVDDDILWLDPAGFPLARCHNMEGISDQLHREFDFFLDTTKSLIEAEPYL